MQMGLLGTAHGAEGGGGDLSGRGSVEGREAQPWPPPGPSAGSVPTVQPKPSSGLHWGQEPRPPRPQALGPWEEMAASPGPVSSQHCQDVTKCHVTIEMPPGRPRKRFCLPEATQMAGPPAPSVAARRPAFLACRRPGEARQMRSRRLRLAPTLGAASPSPHFIDGKLRVRVVGTCSGSQAGDGADL